MKPGRELDALVAENVMGLRRSKELVRSEFSIFPGDWIDAAGHLVYRADEEYPGTTRLYPSRLPRYSTDIAAAWEIIEKFKRDGKGVIVEADDDEYWVGNHTDESLLLCGWPEPEDFFKEHERTISASGATAPEAICLFALKAIENPPKS